ncbi:hypothetical protein JCM5353_001974 [Sporobolomyces roseus]
MFNHLPPELVLQIIEFAIPSPSYTTYKARQHSLQAFCLVCQYLKDIAQPLLFEFVVASNSPRTINQALIVAQSKRWTGCIREVLIIRSGSIGTITSRFERLARNGRGLRGLTFAELEETLDVSLLRNLPQLQLESLTIDHRGACALLPMLSPTVLPALRNLALPYTDEGNFRELRRSRIADLSGQLDALFLPAPNPDPHRTYDHTEYVLAALHPRTLFDLWRISRFSVSFQVSPHPTFCRWIDHLRIPKRLGAANLELLVSKMEQDGSGLKSIYLSPEWQHQASPLLLEKLRWVCQKKSIDVIYEKEDWVGRGAYISEEFCRRQRERRKLESA